MNDTRPSEYESELDSELDSWVSDFLQAEESGTGADEQTRLILRPELRERATSFVRIHRKVQALTGPLRRLVTSPRERPTSGAGRLRQLGSYELLERIGTGGMGEVYKARQTSLQRIVAVKTTRAESVLTDSDLQRFRNEAEFIAKLDHPGIVPVYEVGVVDRQFFYSMRLLEGGDLGKRLSDFRDRPREAAELLAKVAHAVHYAHQRGVLHRDLKPSNILLDERGQPLVADFGLARRLAVHDVGMSRLGLRPDPVETWNGDQSVGTESQPTNESLTMSGVLIGTPGYMAPEQVGGDRELTTATDVYGLGAILYALLTGRPPHHGLDTLDTLLQVKTTEPCAPRQSNPSVDRDLECICLKCLAREPERRYPSAGDLADDLQRWLSGEPIVARPAGVWERLWRRCRRHPAVASLSFAVIVLVIALLSGLAMSVVLLRNEQAETRKQELAAKSEAANARQRERETRRMLYVSDIQQAAKAWESADLSRMAELLDRHTPSREDEDDLRGFEWRYLKQLARSRDDVVSLGQRHQGQVFGVTFSRDGRRLVTSGEDRRVVVWDSASGEKAFELAGFNDDANGILFTPDGKTLIASGEDGSIWTCDAETGANPQKRIQMIDHDPVRHIDINPEGTLLVANCANSHVRRFEFPSMRELADPSLASAHLAKPGPVRFSPDGKTLITSDHGGAILVWDAVSLTRRHLVPSGGEVRGLDIARQKPVAVACGNDRVVLVFDYQSGQVLHRLTGFTHDVLCVAISEDDALVAAADRTGSIRIWELDSGRLINRLPGHAQFVWSLTFAPDNRTIVAGDFSGQVWKWNVGNERWRRTIAQPNDIVRQILHLPQTHEFAWLLHSTGQIAVTDAASVGMDANASRPDDGGGALDKGRTESVFAGDHTVSIAGDGRHWLIGGPHGQLDMWQRGESRPRWRILAHPSWVNSVAFAPDGRTVLSATFGDQVRRWDITTGEARGTLSIDEHPSEHFVVSADGRTAAVASTQSVAIVDLATSQVVRHFRGVTGVVTMTFSANNALLAVARSNQSIEIWNTSSDSRPRILLGHNRAVSSLAFSPDQRTLASAAQDGTVRLWSVEQGLEFLTLHSAEFNNTVTFSPDGQRLFVGGHDSGHRGELLAWDAPDLHAMLPPSGGGPPH